MRAIVTRSGRERIIAWHNKILFDDKGNFNGILCSGEDVTERRKAENALLLTQFAVDHASDGVFWMDRQGKFIYVNHAASALLGYSERELLSKTYPELCASEAVSDESARVCFETIRERKSQTYEAVFYKKNEEKVSVEVQADYFKFRGDEFGFIYIRDITSRKQTEDLIRTLSTTVEQNPTSIFITDPDGVVEYVNQKYVELTEFSRDESVGYPANILESGFLEQEDFDRLRLSGWTDEDILGITLAAAARAGVRTVAGHAELPKGVLSFRQDDRITGRLKRGHAVLKLFPCLRLRDTLLFKNFLIIE